MTSIESLDRAGAVEEPDPDLLIALESSLAVAVEADIARRARYVRRRRAARISGIGVVAAAAVVGVVVAQPSGTTRVAQAKEPTVSKTPISPRFRTVAQVVNAAASAISNVDPTAAPYWKVELKAHDIGDRVTDNGTNCIVINDHSPTIWWGNGRASVSQDLGGLVGEGKPVALPRATVTIDGTTMSWRQANARHWSIAQLRSLVPDNGPSPQQGGPIEGWYVFKNTGDILTDSPASAAIRKELWRNLASLPAVKLVGRATDSLGRQGWKLSISDPSVGTASYIVDTSTGQLLEQSQTSATSREPDVITLVTAGPSQTAPKPVPLPSGPPVDRGAPHHIKQLTYQQLLAQARAEAEQPKPYPMCK